MGGVRLVRNETPSTQVDGFRLRLKPPIIDLTAVRHLQTKTEVRRRNVGGGVQWQLVIELLWEQKSLRTINTFNETFHRASPLAPRYVDNV